VYRQGILRGVLGALVLVGALAVAAPASGAKFKQLGKPASKVGAGESCGTCDTFQFETAPSSPSYVVPKGKWKIVAWKAHGLKKGEGKSKARLRIYRPTAVVDQYEIVSESGIESFPAGEITRHRTRIKVKKGDHLGIVGVGEFASSVDSSRFADTAGAPTGCAPTVGVTVGGVGADCALSTFASSRVNVGATLKKRN
jgi:hypothetical protein